MLDMVPASVSLQLSPIRTKWVHQKQPVLVPLVSISTGSISVVWLQPVAAPLLPRLRHPDGIFLACGWTSDDVMVMTSHFHLWFHLTNVLVHVYVCVCVSGDRLCV